MLIHHCLERSASAGPDTPALTFKKHTLSYSELERDVSTLAGGLQSLGLLTGDRVAIFLPKQLETVVGIFAISAAGGCFVPINPVLKPAQVIYQLQHSDARILVTSAQRLSSLADDLASCPELRHIIVVDAEFAAPSTQPVHLYSDLLRSENFTKKSRIDADMAAILYTSGSTGRPKGVVLSHRNLVAGAQSVSSYLGNGPRDRILAVLPLSFDAGLSQITTGIFSGAGIVLMDYLLPRDVLNVVARERITGITGVPSLWNPLSRLEWSQPCVESLRYLANTGGAMPERTTRALAEKLPGTSLFLMYGLTEAFRSTFLPPAKALEKPTSVGQAIPNAEVLIVDDQGRECAPGEHGELVHRGAHVALGYWKNPEATAERFRPAPGQPAGLPREEIAVWSGDTAYRDSDGDIFFVSRRDAMIKTNGYRVSPTDIEIEALTLAGVAEAAAVGVTHPDIGQAIVLIVASDEDPAEIEVTLRKTLTAALPAFMLPLRILVEHALPLNPNGKVDRPALAEHFPLAFAEF